RAVVGSRAGGQAQRGYKAEGADEVSDASSHVRVPLMGSWLVGRAICGPGVRGATLHPEGLLQHDGGGRPGLRAGLVGVSERVSCLMVDDVLAIFTKWPLERLCAEEPPLGVDHHPVLVSARDFSFCVEGRA